MPRLIPRNFRSIGREVAKATTTGTTRFAEAKAFIGARQISVYDRALLRAAAKSVINEPKGESQREAVRKMMASGFLEQVDVFPSKYALTPRGQVALDTVNKAEYLRGVKLTASPNEVKALRLLASKELVPPFNTAETRVLAGLVTRKLAALSAQGNYTLTPLGRTILREQR